MKQSKMVKLETALAIIAIVAFLAVSALLPAHVIYSWLAPETFWEKIAALIVATLAAFGGSILAITIVVVILKLTE